MCKLPGHQTAPDPAPVDAHGRVWFVLAVGWEASFQRKASIGGRPACITRCVSPSSSPGPREVIGHEEHKGWHSHLTGSAGFHGHIDFT